MIARTVFALAWLAASACGPDLGPKDHAFEARLRNLVTGRPEGPVAPDETAAILRTLFDNDVVTVCIVGGGDIVPDVKYQWKKAAAPLPIPESNLRDTGSGEIGYDSYVAVVGIDAAGLGWVRRGSFGGECTDYGDITCWPVRDARLEIVSGRVFETGRILKALRIASTVSDAHSCPIEPYPQ